jgi:predicted metal-dependent hydrolase
VTRSPKSAKTLATRADLSLAMNLPLRVSDKAALDFAQEKQKHIGEAMEQKQIGILALAMFKKEYRHAVYYVSDRDAAQILIEHAIGSNAYELRAEHDFSWSKYRHFADLPDKEPRRK